jgi:uncharacterized membrane protein
MTTNRVGQPSARHPTEDQNRLAESVDRIAASLVDVHTELHHLSRLLRGRQARADNTGSQPPNRTFEPPSPPPTANLARREPVDTSHARPEQTPAAPAAGVPAYQGPFRNAPPHAAHEAPFRNAAPVPEQPTLSERFAHWASREGAGTRVLAWAGGAVTLLGIVLLLIMAVQQGWIGPLGRVLSGAGLGAGLLGCAAWVHRRSSEAGRTGAFALVATGIATLYLDVLAATALYGYLPMAIGLAMALAVAGCGLWCADRWSSQALAVGVVLGCALCAPILFGSMLGHGSSPAALLTAFLVILKIAATPVQLRRAWSALTATSALPAVLSACVANGQALRTDDPWPAAAAALAVTISGIALAVGTARRRPHDPTAIALLLIAGAPALIVAPMLGRWPGFGMIATVTAVYFAIWRARKYLPQRLTTVAGGACALAVFQASVSTVGGSARPLTLLGEAAILALLAVRLRGKRMLLTATIYGGIGTVLALAMDVPPTLFFRFPARPYVVDGAAQYGAITVGGLAFLLVGAVSVALPWSAVRLGVLATSGKRHARGLPTWVLPGGLYSGSGVVLSICLSAVPSETGFLAGHALITVSWMALAFFLLMRGIQSLSPRIAGFVLVAVVLSKLVLFDLAALDGLARVGAFLGAGLLLLAGGTTYARLISRRHRVQPE